MRRVLALGALLLAVVLLAACSDDSGGDGIATAGGTGSDKSAEKELSDEERQAKFAECMRDNGIDMPDPEPGEPSRMTVREGDRAKMEKAMDACRELLPNGGEFKPSQADLEAMREHAKCMRANGVPEFPDPDPEGGGIRIQRGQDGMDPEDPEFQAAMEKCRDKLPERGPRGSSGGGDR